VWSIGGSGLGVPIFYYACFPSHGAANGWEVIIDTPISYLTAYLDLEDGRPCTVFDKSGTLTLYIPIIYPLYAQLKCLLYQLSHSLCPSSFTRLISNN